jgi:hypothetical protein
MTSLAYASNYVKPLVQVFEAMMEKRQNQIPDEGFLMTKKKEEKKSKERPKYRNSLCGYSVHCSKEN